MTDIEAKKVEALLSARKRKKAGGGKKLPKKAADIVAELSKIMAAGGQAIHAIRERGDAALSSYDEEAYTLLLGRLQGAATSMQRLANKAKG